MKFTIYNGRMAINFGIPRQKDRYSNGVLVAETLFADSYPEATKSALGACNGGSITSPLDGSLYPVVIVKG